METRQSSESSGALVVESIDHETLRDPDKLLKLFGRCTPFQIKRIIETHFQPDSELYQRYEFMGYQMYNWDHSGSGFACLILMTNQPERFFEYPDMFLLRLEKVRKRIAEEQKLSGDNPAANPDHPVIAALLNIEYMIRIYHARVEVDNKITASRKAGSKAYRDAKWLKDLYEPCKFNANALIPNSFNNFQGMDLTGFDFSGLDMRTFLLNDAVLTRANLNKCMLDDMRIRHAFMHGTNLADACMKNTDLSQSWVCETNLHGVDTSTTKFHEPDAISQELLVPELLLQKFDSLSPEELKRMIVEKFHDDSLHYKVYKNLVASYKNVADIPDDLYLCYALMTTNIHKLDGKHLSAVINRTHFVNPSLRDGLCATLHIVRHRETHDKYDYGDDRRIKFDKSALKAGCYINLQRADLTDRNDLSYIDFRLTNLKRASFDSSNLSFANFSGMDLRFTNFWRSKLHAADLSCCNLTGERMFNWANLFAANLSGSDLSGAIMEGTDMRCVDMRNTKLVRTRFEGVDLQHSDFRRAKFDRTIFTDEHNGADYCNLSYANFSGADLRNSNLGGHNYSNNLIGTNFSHADLSGHQCLYLTSPYTDFSYANLANIMPRYLIEKCNLTGANLSGADLSNCEIKDCNLTGAKLTGVHVSDWHPIQNCTLARADLGGMKWCQDLSDETRLGFFDGIPLTPVVLDLYLTYLLNMFATVEHKPYFNVKNMGVPTSLALELKAKVDMLEPEKRHDALVVASHHSFFRGSRRAVKLLMPTETREAAPKLPRHN